MKWSVFGKILAKALPHAVELAEKLLEPDANKKKVAIEFAHDELHELAPEIAKHPKVLEAIGNANDALVELHNVVAHVEADLEANKPKEE